MEKTKCNKFETCSVALCPLDPNPHHYWFADTEICPKSGLADWIKKQKKIQKVNPDPHSYYTVKMLKSIKRVSADITGLNTIGYYERAEREWIRERENRHNDKSVTPLKGCDKIGFLGATDEKTGGIIQRPHPYPSENEIRAF